MQAYVALTAAFARLFFANFTAGEPGELWAPRMYTVLPVTAILFYVYWRAGSDKQDSGGKSRLPFEALLAYLGTGSIVALLYFQFPNDWLVTAWAVVVFMLSGLAMFSIVPFFCIQALLLTLGRLRTWHCLTTALERATLLAAIGRDDILCWARRWGFAGVLAVCLPVAGAAQNADWGEGWIATVVRRPNNSCSSPPCAAHDNACAGCVPEWSRWRWGWKGF